MFEVNTMSVPEPPDIIETPHHFWYGPVDLATASQGNTKVEKLSYGYVMVTKTFLAKSYKQSSDALYDFAKLEGR